MALESPDTTAPSFRRCFVAIVPPPPILEAVRHWQASLKRRLANVGSIRWTPRAHFHLTLSFLGNVAETELPNLATALTSATGESKPFTLKLDRPGCFPDPMRPRVLWIGLSGALTELDRLQHRVKDHCAPFSSHTEYKPFHPHLTIARDKRPSPRVARQLDDLFTSYKESADHSWEVTELELVESRITESGANYITLSRAKLGTGVEPAA